MNDRELEKKTKSEFSIRTAQPMCVKCEEKREAIEL